jgi:hypothetical protein
MIIKHLLFVLAYIIYKNIHAPNSFQRRKLCFLGNKPVLFVEKAEMFEEMAANAVQTLIFIFWATLAYVIIWGALWVRAQKKTKASR